MHAHTHVLPKNKVSPHVTFMYHLCCSYSSNLIILIFFSLFNCSIPCMLSRKYLVSVIIEVDVYLYVFVCARTRVSSSMRIYDLLHIHVFVLVSCILGIGVKLYFSKGKIAAKVLNLCEKCNFGRNLYFWHRHL